MEKAAFVSSSGDIRYTFFEWIVREYILDFNPSLEFVVHLNLCTGELGKGYAVFSESKLDSRCVHVEVTSSDMFLAVEMLLDKKTKLVIDRLREKEEQSYNKMVDSWIEN